VLAGGGNLRLAGDGAFDDHEPRRVHLKTPLDRG
jgi:hypothetical protein